MGGPVSSSGARRGRWLALLPLALIVVAACGQQTPAYSGLQPRTPIDKIPAGGQMRNFTLVANNPLTDARFNIPRGQNGGMAAIRDCLYVGSNIANQPMLVLDMKDMTKPTVVGDVPQIKGRSMGTESFQGVSDLNFLVVTARTGAVGKVTVDAADKTIGMVVYDVTDCRKPTIAAKIDVFNEQTHYMNLWRDPKKPDRVLASLSYSGNTDGVDIRVWDLTGCPKSCSPKMVAEWGLRAQLGIPQTIVTKYEGGQRSQSTTTHDHTYSIDGTRIHLAQTYYGYMQIDSSALAEGRACNPKAATSPTATGHCLTVFPNFKPLPPFGVEVATVHGVVAVPGRPYVILNHEGTSCPFGGMSIAYIGNQDTFSTYDRQTGTLTAAGGASVGAFRGDLFPRRVGTFSIPEQQPDRCPKQGDAIPATTSATGVYGQDVMRSSKTIHDSIAFPSVVFATWDAGGVRAIDITNPYTPFELGFFFNKPASEVRWCNGRSGPCETAEVDAEGVAIRQRGTLPPDIEARSYPITMNGYLVYTDSPSGVYVLKYTGPHADEIPQQGTCIAQNPSSQSIGFDPCKPYKTWTP
jgi:hypothetical protein